MRDHGAMNDPNFNPEKFFQELEKTRKKQRLLERKKKAEKLRSQSPKAAQPDTPPRPKEQVSQATVLLAQHPDIDLKLQAIQKNPAERSKIEQSVDEMNNEIRKRYFPSGSSQSISKHLLSS